MNCGKNKYWVSGLVGIFLTYALQSISFGAEVGSASSWKPEFSTAGFYRLPDSGREGFNFNPGWRFFKGQAPGAQAVDFNDSGWEAAALPHGLELLPLEASGSINYQGEAWYRKNFRIPESASRKKLFLHFEAIMGKCKVWVNGKPVADHFGGYLPVIADISDAVDWDGENVVAVWADNSDDGLYPPGKPQAALDFAYFGGIYRDAWLVGCNPVHITDPNHAGKAAEGGIFVRYEEFSDERVVVVIQTDIQNDTDQDASLVLEAGIYDADGKQVGKSAEKTVVARGKSGVVEQRIVLDSPHMWHPDDPYLHNLHLLVKNLQGKTLDGMRQRIGVRHVEIRPGEGLYLNGKRFEDKLIGANRHQDYAYVGNAMPNNAHWRDARKLREAGVRVIRNAHYPQDPAFMDACDELGMFVIVTTPGWQYWNPNPVFVNRVLDDIRNMIRRDRSHPSIFIWEPILNESHFSSEFSANVVKLVHEEFPGEGCYTACDSISKGKELFDVNYGYPQPATYFEENSGCMFTREWGDNVDDWSAHNSPSRVCKAWGEVPQLKQMRHYAKPDYNYICYDSLYRSPKQHIGGALWHSFDHQRGYHPDPFWGGIMDAFRQPKYSWHMFKSQVDPKAAIEHVPTGPYVFIPHEMGPFSPKDVWVLSNCDEVRLTVLGADAGTKSTKKLAMPHAPVVFKDVFDFQKIKALHRQKKKADASIVAEGLIDGKVVATAVRLPALRREKLTLTPDFSGAPLVADGGDFIPVVAHFVDERGGIKRLAEDYIRFTVTGAGELIDDGQIAANPRKMTWGEAVALVRAGSTPGKITITAEVLRAGRNVPDSAELIIESMPGGHQFVQSTSPSDGKKKAVAPQEKTSGEESVKALKKELEDTRNELKALRIKEVERQQEEFEGVN